MSRTDARMEALRAFVAGFHHGTREGAKLGAPGVQAERLFNHWWGDPSVARARAARASNVPRIEALRAFVAGFHHGSRGGKELGAPGVQAERLFNHWWTDPSVVRARTARCSAIKAA